MFIFKIKLNDGTDEDEHNKMVKSEKPESTYIIETRHSILERIHEIEKIIKYRTKIVIPRSRNSVDYDVYAVTDEDIERYKEELERKCKELQSTYQE